MRRARSKRKGRFGRAPVQWPSARDGGLAYRCRSADLQLPFAPDRLCLRGCNCRPAAARCGEIVGVVAALHCSYFRCRCTASAKNAAARSERNAGERSWSSATCNPVTKAPAQREQRKPVPHPDASVQRIIVNPQAPSHASRRAGTLRLAQSPRPKRFFFWTVRGPFLFWQGSKEKWGAHPACTMPPAGRISPRSPSGDPQSPSHPHNPNQNPSIERKKR